MQPYPCNVNAGCEAGNETVANTQQNGNYCVFICGMTSEW